MAAWSLPSSTGSRAVRWIRPQDLIWVVLFAALAIFGPDRFAGTVGRF